MKPQLITDENSRQSLKLGFLILSISIDISVTQLRKTILYIKHASDVMSCMSRGPITRFLRGSLVVGTFDVYTLDTAVPGIPPTHHGTCALILYPYLRK